MNLRREILIGLILFSVLASAGFFYWWFFYETPPEKWGLARYSKSDDYVITETSEGRKVVNKKAGISFLVPDGWQIEKHRDHILLISGGFLGDIFVEEGCKVVVEARYIKTSLFSVEEVLKEGHGKWGGTDYYEVIIFSGKNSLKNESEISSLDQYLLTIYVPTKKNLRSIFYTIGLNCHIRDRDNCVKEFESFLKTVSIE